jgi:bifunctional UDP-N-acetylglucosamine pyrophosphorylase / glucosamine-1-phosphate N-acetyltransferase
MTENLTVVILAAGLGTRMKSRKAKVLHEAGGLALVEHVVNSALALTTPDRIVVVVGHQADRVQQVLAGKGVRFAEQTEQKGTGHALEVCRTTVPDHEGRLVVLYGDCPLLSVRTLERLIQDHAAATAAATVITTELDNPTGYGRAIVGDDRMLQEIVEEKAATPEQKKVREINSGIYCFEAPLLWKHLSDVTPNPASNEYYLTDIVEIFNRSGYGVRALLHEDADELLGINTRLELAIVDNIFRERKSRELMLSGVTIRRPETVLIDTAVKVGMDTVIEPFAQLLGSTVVGEDSVIGAGCILRNCQVADRVEISPYTIAQDSRIDSGATIGPFARLRPDNHVEANAHIGNFVELKKTRLGAGAKAGHLAYLGDSEIGAGSNIGAGTIFCNYDGAKKHKTDIGEGSFIGSNSTLVAPVHVGSGAYIAAGSVITTTVADDALGIGRSRQTVKEGWAKRRRERQVSREPRT